MDESCYFCEYKYRYKHNSNPVWVVATRVDDNDPYAWEFYANEDSTEIDFHVTKVAKISYEEYERLRELNIHD